MVNAIAGRQEMLGHLSLTEARILYIRNLLLILLSFLVGGPTLLSILASFRSRLLSPICKFSHILVSLPAWKIWHRSS